MDVIQKTNYSLEFDKIKEELSKYAKFEQSKALCLNLCPSSDVDKIKHQIEYTREAKIILDKAKETAKESPESGPALSLI